MILYRIERAKDQNGPYSTEAMRAYERYADAHATDGTNPAPYEDRPPLPPPYSPDYPRGYRFGFYTKALLAAWFHSAEGRKAMHELGWKPYAFKLNAKKHKVLKAKKQCIFNRDAAEVVAELHPVTLKPMKEKTHD